MGVIAELNCLKSRLKNYVGSGLLVIWVQRIRK
jgi:hypothetical protein